MLADFNTKTKGNIGWTSNFEVISRNGEIYYAPRHNALDVDGWRCGARWECNDTADNRAFLEKNMGVMFS